MWGVVRYVCYEIQHRTCGPRAIRHLPSVAADQFADLPDLTPPAVGDRAIPLDISNDAPPVVPDLKTPTVTWIIYITDHLPAVIRAPAMASDATSRTTAQINSRIFDPL